MNSRNCICLRGKKEVVIIFGYLVYSLYKQAGQQIGWTGFTWDPHLFPDPKQFLDW